MFNETRQSLIQETNDAMDRFAILFQDYTIDYEEYYNRKKTGCSTFNEMTSRTVNGSGFCTIFTAY
jgi:SAM-dependent MidA family methyltransferase